MISVSVGVQILPLAGGVYASVAAPDAAAKVEEEVTLMEIEEQEPETPRAEEPPPPAQTSVVLPPPEGFQELIPPDQQPPAITGVAKAGKERSHGDEHRRQDRGPAADINMTLTIDILLVLLITFMVVQQELSVQVPPVKDASVTAQALDQIVPEMQPGGRYSITQQPVASGGLQARLTEIFAPRPRTVIFVKGAENITYGDVVFVVDVARASGIGVVGLVPRS